MTKETGIIMSGNHPKLILDGIKTMTRRVIKPVVEYDGAYCLWRGRKPYYWGAVDKPNILEACPYGQGGDRLWVKETYSIDPFRGSEGLPVYKAGLNNEALACLIGGDDWSGWKPSIFMPQWASRILLEITELRAERLQEISWRDCEREGADPEKMPFSVNVEPWKEAFERLWDSLNAKRGYGWDTNPWVWVIGFKVIKGGLNADS